MTHATLALVHLASPARLLRLGLHPPRLPPLRRVDHRPGPQRRGAHHHPVRPGPGPARGLEGPGVLRRVRRLARRPRHPRPDPPGRDRPRAAPGTATASGPSTTPRSIAPARTSGAPAPSTSTPPAAPTAPPPSGPTTGSSSAPCCHEPGKPAWFLPIAGRLYFRKSQLPAGPEPAARAVPHQVRAGRRAVPRAGPAHAGGPHLAVFDGGFALGSVVRPLVLPEDGAPPHRVPDPAAARRPALRPAADGAPRGQAGADAEVGQAAAAAAAGGPLGRAVAGRAWPSSTAASGRSAGRRWSACGGCSGHEVPVKAVVAQVEGYKKRFTLVSSAAELTGLQMVELFAARFRQEDGFRDLKQRLGWEECRAWTAQPDRADQPGAVGDA